MKPAAPPPGPHLGEAEWEVLHLLYDALNQLRKMTLSFSELRYLAVEHNEAEIRAAVTRLLDPPGLIVGVPNLTNLPIYRISPAGRDLVQARLGPEARPPQR
jgi:hypothetical protein